jgi:hypothetical protein
VPGPGAVVHQQAGMSALDRPEFAADAVHTPWCSAIDGIETAVAVPQPAHTAARRPVVTRVEGRLSLAAA